MIKQHKKILNDVINPIKTRLNLAIWMNSALGPLIYLFGALATILLVLKMVRPDFAPFSAGILLFLPLVFVHAYIYCTKNRIFFRPYEVAEIIDHLYHNDGSVTAFYENPELFSDPRFSSKLKSELSDRIPRMDPLFYGKRIAPVIFFLALALVIPARMPQTEQKQQQIISAITKPLFNKIEENMDILSEEEKTEFEKKLDQIKNEKTGISKEKWEAVEEIKDRIDNMVAKKNQNIHKMISEMNEISNLISESSQSEGDSLNQLQLDKLLNDLQMNMASNPLSPQMQSNMQKLMKQMKDAPDMAQLRKCLGSLKSQLSCCCKEPWYDLCEGEGGTCSKDGDGMPGRGGINRGRGDAPMVFGFDKTLPEARFQDKEIQNKYFQPRDLIDLGITPVEPEPDPGKFSPGTLKKFDPLEGTQVSRTRISPGQRDVISRYFEK